MGLGVHCRIGSLKNDRENKPYLMDLIPIK